MRAEFSDRKPMPNPTDPHAALKRNSVLIASMLFMIVGTGSIYFLVVALKLISAEFGWPRAVPSIGYSLQYFGGGIGGTLLRTAIATGWERDGVRRMTVNTCTLDHPRALELYKRMDFSPVRTEEHTRILTRDRDTSQFPA